MRILVVDDEPSVRDALDRALRMDGYRVQLAADGREALDALAHQPPDAIVLDVLMPEPDGLEVCRRLRAAGRSHAGADAHRARRGARPRERARRGRRRLPRQAVRARGAGRAAAGAAAPHRRPGRGDARATPDIELDPAGHTVTRDGRPVELTRTEFLLLELLMRHPRQVLDPHADLRARLGLRLRPELELARGLRRLPAPQARRAAGDPDGARRRLRPARGSELPAPARAVLRRRGRDRRRARLRRSPTGSCATRCAARSTTRCAAGRDLHHRPPMAADEAIAGEAGAVRSSPCPTTACC